MFLIFFVHLRFPLCRVYLLSHTQCHINRDKKVICYGGEIFTYCIDPEIKKISINFVRVRCTMYDDDHSKMMFEQNEVKRKKT